jgi:hypothetical protein
MADGFCELIGLLTDAGESLDRAETLAGELSGEQGGRAPSEWTERLPCPECDGSGFGCVACNSRGYFDLHESDPGEPSVPGSPELIALAAAIAELRTRLNGLVTADMQKWADAEREYEDSLCRD